MRQPTGQMLSVSGQAAEKADATTDLTMSERPLHDYVAEVSERTDVRVGVPLPLGTYACGEGVNFAFFNRHASRVRLELFDHPEDATAARVIDLDPTRDRTGGTDVAGEISDVVFTRPDLTLDPWFIRLCHRTRRIIR